MSRAGIALTATTTAELIIDTPAIVALGANHDEPAELFDFIGQFDVGATTSHVSCEGDGAFFASFFNNSGFTLVIFSVQELIGEAGLIEIFGNKLVFND